MWRALALLILLAALLGAPAITAAVSMRGASPRVALHLCAAHRRRRKSRMGTDAAARPRPHAHFAICAPLRPWPRLVSGGDASMALGAVVAALKIAAGGPRRAYPSLAHWRSSFFALPCRARRRRRRSRMGTAAPRARGGDASLSSRPSAHQGSAAQDLDGVWSPDGTRLVFASNRGTGGTYAIYQKDSSGSGNEELLLKSGMSRFPHDWSPDGRYLLYTVLDPKTRTDLWVLPVAAGTPGDRKPAPYLQTPFHETQGQFSPDGHWIAYTSD